MNLLPSERRLYMRFDFFCKKVMAYINFKLLHEEQKRRERGCVFSDLSEDILDQYYSSWDEYPGLALRIDLKNIRVSIENEMLYQALLLLPEKRLEIILLSFFGDLTDKEIAEIMIMPKSTVQYNRNAAIRYIRKIMEVGMPSNEKQKRTR